MVGASLSKIIRSHTHPFVRLEFRELSSKVASLSVSGLASIVCAGGVTADRT
jgi:hypothetical protein